MVGAMSFEAGNVDHELTTEELLTIIANQLILLNERFEHLHETQIELSDIEGIK